jgi:hypothetical protein
MLASVGIPEGGIWQPARVIKLKAVRIAAMNRERMSLTPNRMASPLLDQAVISELSDSHVPKYRQPIGEVSRYILEIQISSNPQS